jgi:hypothetical protein
MAEFFVRYKKLLLLVSLAYYFPKTKTNETSFYNFITVLFGRLHKPT